MTTRTEDLWAAQQRLVGDRRPLFRAVARHADIESVLYPGSYVDITPSFVWPAVTYLDIDARARRFFADEDGVGSIIARESEAPPLRSFTFLAADYTEPLPAPANGFDLLISLYAGLVSVHCVGHLRPGGLLLVNPSHGDAAMASVDPRLELTGVIGAASGECSVTTSDLESYFVPKRPLTESVADVVARTGRGIGYTRSAFAYLFRRVV